MRNLCTLTRRELGTLFLSPALHLATAFFVFVYSLLFILVIFTEGVATFDSMALWVCFMSMFLAPLITMRSFAEERASGTIELLLTSPVDACEVVLSKFIGCFVFYCATLVPLTVHILLLAYCGKLDWGATFANVLGLILSGALFVALGILASSLTASQIVAAAGGVVVNLVLLFLSTLEEQGSGALATIGSISFVPHFKNSFALGMIDMPSLTYFLTVTPGVLFLTWIGVRSRGMLSRARGKTDRRWALFAGGALALAAVIALVGITWLHVEGVGPMQLREMIVGQADTAASADEIPDLAAAFTPDTEVERPGPGMFVLYSLPFLMGLAMLVIAGLCWKRARAGNTEGLFSYLKQDEVVPTLITALSVIVLLVNINFLANYPLGTLASEGAPLSWLSVFHVTPWDLTETGENTLHIDTRKTLDELSEPIEITVFYSAAVDYEGVRMQAQTKDLLERYATYSSLVRPMFVDAELERGRALRLAQQMGLVPQYLHQAAVIEYQGRRTIVPAGMCLKAPDPVAAMAGHKQYTYNGELAFTIAIKRLMDPRSTRVYFTDGHGEYRIDSTKNEPQSVGRFAETLGRETMEVRRHFLRDEPIPADCDVLIMPGPLVPIGKSVAKHLEDYVLAGGRLMVLMPPVVQPMRAGQEARQTDPDLNKLMKSWGGAVNNDTLFDSTTRYGGQAMNVYALANKEHPIASSGRTVRCVTPMARSMRFEPTSVRDEGWRADRLLVSPASTQAHTKTRDGLSTERGPFTIAYTSEKEPLPGQPAPRVAVFGNVDFVSNLALDIEHNQALAVSTVHWLAGRDYNIRIDPPGFVDRKLKMTPPQQRLMLWITLLWLPLAWVLLALGVWWVRKE